MELKLSEDMLKDFLETGKNWGRMKTNLPGVFVVKLPAYRSSPKRLAVEINPVDASGNPTKRRGLFLRSAEELESFKQILDEEKLSRLLILLDSVNPISEDRRRKTEEDVIEL